MAKLFYVHWDESECRAHARELESAGHEVEVHWSKERNALIGEETDVLIISLDRLPSHGRAVAEWFWESKKRQAKPLVFVGGETSKAADTKQVFPTARFCSRPQWISTLTAVKGATRAVEAVPTEKKARARKPIKGR